MGAIIRTVAGAGCEMLYSTKGCVDIWNSKTLRAGSGGHFKIPLLSSLQWHDIENLIPADSKVYVAISNVSNSRKYLRKHEGKNVLRLFGFLGTTSEYF